MKLVTRAAIAAALLVAIAAANGSSFIGTADAARTYPAGQVTRANFVEWDLTCDCPSCDLEAERLRERVRECPKYDRDLFPHWRDLDGNGRNARHDALFDESRILVATNRNASKVLSGEWLCPMTGLLYTDPSDVDTDHTVALGLAWEWGACHWSTEKRKAYANDLANTSTLINVDDSTNQSKGKRGPCEWMPPINQCQYLIDVARVAGDPRWLFEIPADDLRCIVDGIALHCTKGS